MKKEKLFWFLFFLTICLATLSPSAEAFAIDQESYLPNASSSQVVTLIASSISAHQALLNGKVENKNSKVLARGFDYGTSTNYGLSASTSVLVKNENFSLVTGRLPSNTIYHYRAWVEDDSQKIYGEDVSFRTRSCDSSLLHLILDNWRNK